MTRQRRTIYVGVKGSVLAVDRDTGAVAWEAPLKGSDFVNVAIDDGELYAATRGRIYRIDPATGAVLWVNELPGYGLGIVTVAGSSSPAPAAEKKRRDDAAAGAAAAGAAT